MWTWGILLTLALLAVAVWQRAAHRRHAYHPERCKTEGHVPRTWWRRYYREPIGARERWDAMLYEVTEHRLRCRRCQTWLESRWAVEHQERLPSVTWPAAKWERMRANDGNLLVGDGWV